MDSKQCTKCKVVKPLGDFRKRRDARDGLRKECKVCKAVLDARYWAENAEKARISSARWRAENAEKLKEKRSRYYAENWEREREHQAQYYVDNREKLRECSVRWRSNNADLLRANSAKRRAAKLLRTPEWTCNETTKAVYGYAKWIEEIGVKCHVDHIIPLQGTKVSGLHVPWNLRVVTDTENLSKNNRMPKSAHLIPSALDDPGFHEFLNTVHVPDCE